MKKETALSVLRNIFAMRKMSDGPDEYNRGLIEMHKVAESFISKNWPEPEKVIIPQHIANWIEYSKAQKYCLGFAMINPVSNKVNEWLNNVAVHQDLFARAWLDDYEVEKAPVWIVRVNSKLVFGEFDSGKAVFNWGSDGIKAHVFDDREEAEEVAELLAGTVIKCGDTSREE